MIPYSPTITTTRATTRDETPVPTTDAATFRPEPNPEVPNGVASPVFSQGADPPRDVEALVGAVDDDDEGVLLVLAPLPLADEVGFGVGWRSAFLRRAKPKCVRY